VFTQLGDVLVWLLVRAASESERTGRRYVSQYLPCTHSSRPSNPVTFVTLYLRHACSFAQHLFPHNAISLSISLPTYVELLTQYPIYHGGCYMMALLTSFRLCQKVKKKKGFGVSVTDV
jgi:hypothetical protein